MYDLMTRETNRENQGDLDTETKNYGRLKGREGRGVKRKESDSWRNNNQKNESADAHKAHVSQMTPKVQDGLNWPVMSLQWN